MRLSGRFSRPSSVVTSMAFQPSNALNNCFLAVLTAANEVYIADVNKMTYLTLPLASTSADKSASAIESLSTIPSYIRQLPNALCGLTFDNADPMKILMYGQSMIVHVDLREPVPEKAKIVSTNEIANRKNLKKKRKFNENAPVDPNSLEARELKSAADSSNFSTVSLFRSIVHVHSLDGNRLVSRSICPVVTIFSFPEPISRLELLSSSDDKSIKNLRYTERGLDFAEGCDLHAISRIADGVEHGIYPPSSMTTSLCFPFLIFHVVDYVHPNLTIMLLTDSST
jgi:hypothetical protein